MVGVALASVALAACGDDDDAGPTTTVDVEAPATEAKTTTKTTEPETTKPRTTETLRPANPEVTVVIHGKSYTCAEIVANEDQQLVPCGDTSQNIFNVYGDNIDAFVNSRRLGPVNGDPFTYADAAFLGITACALRVQGHDVDYFIDYVSAQPPFNQMDLDLGRLTFLPVWFEAPRSLCPGP